MTSGTTQHRRTSSSDPSKSVGRTTSVSHGQFVAGTLGNGVSLAELMDTLGASAFASTRDNAASGHGNTDPRKAIRQQPHIRLTTEAAAWVTARLEEAFRMQGTVPTEALERLDWP